MLSIIEQLRHGRQFYFRLQMTGGMTKLYFTGHPGRVTLKQAGLCPPTDRPEDEGDANSETSGFKTLR